MKHLLPILAALCLLSSPAVAQTVKALAYNTTNGQVVYSGTNTLTFVSTLAFGDDVSGTAFESSAGTNSTRLDDSGISFGGSAAAATRANLGFSTNLNTFWTATNAATARTNLSLGAAWLTNTNVTNFRSAVGLAPFTSDGYAELRNGAGEVILQVEDGVTIYREIYFDGTNAPANSAITRTNLGVGLPALTNTSNVTMMRALSGSTNTNHPYSGTVALTNTNAVLTFSNGILQSAQ